mgnify:CR=1 FL=1
MDATNDMRFPRNAKIFRGQLDAAPFAGVFFLLVIFLMLNSMLVSVPGVRIELPQSGNVSGVVGPKVVVAIDRNGQIYFQNQSLSDAELKEQLRGAVLKARQAQQELVVLALVDKNVSSQTWVHFAELANDAGVKEVLQVTRPRMISEFITEPEP